jgi:LmbE family N-acetylglucosaminyl deacetylase
MKLDILAFAAHPDDVELSCAGTLIAHIQAGKNVGIVDLTKGELGTRGTPEIRAQEAADATKIMGLHVRENLGFADGFFTISSKKDPEIPARNCADECHLRPPSGPWKRIEAGIGSLFFSRLKDDRKF